MIHSMLYTLGNPITYGFIHYMLHYIIFDQNDLLNFKMNLMPSLTYYYKNSFILIIIIIIIMNGFLNKIILLRCVFYIHIK